eukprot:642351-Hanusia_phi.AAC.1
MSPSSKSQAVTDVFANILFTEASFSFRFRGEVIYKIKHLEKLEDAAHLDKPKVKHLFLGKNKVEQYSPILKKNAVINDFKAFLLKKTHRTKPSEQSTFGDVQGTCIYCAHLQNDMSDKNVRCKQVIYSPIEDPDKTLCTLFLGVCEAHTYSDNDVDCTDYISMLSKKKLNMWFKECHSLNEKLNPNRGIIDLDRIDDDEIIPESPNEDKQDEEHENLEPQGSQTQGSQFFTEQIADAMQVDNSEASKEVEASMEAAKQDAPKVVESVKEDAPKVAEPVKEDAPK